MLKVTITTFDSPVTVQDPRPTSQTALDQAVVSVEPNDVREMIMQWGQLERIQAQLTDLAALDLITFTIEPVTAVDGVAEFAEQNQNIDAPAIDVIDNGGAGITVGGDSFDIVGTNLLGGQVRANASVAGDTALGSILLEDLNPSYDGNLYDVEVIIDGAGVAICTHAVVDGRTLITVNLRAAGAETCTTIAALINADMAGLVQATVVLAGATTITTVQAVTPFVDGAGTGLSVTLAGLACVVNTIDESAAPIFTVNVTSPDVSGTGGAAGDSASLVVRAYNKVAQASTVLA